jgi:hypothetical protein
MLTVSIPCEKCGLPIGRTENRLERRNGQTVPVELYICTNPECRHIEKVYPDDLVDIEETGSMVFNYNY